VQERKAETSLSVVMSRLRGAAPPLASPGRRRGRNPDPLERATPPPTGRRAARRLPSPKRAGEEAVDSIPEDKSSGLSGVAAFVAMLRGLALPGLKGAGTLGATIERDALHRSLESIEKM
jgi:hypothetical protein